MTHTRTITILVILVVLLAAVASGTGILSREGSGPSTYLSVRGETVELYGRGLYAHMSSAVAIQGIAQDYITLCVALPLLVIALILFRKGSLRATIVLAGLLLYMLLTYLFYTAMAMYNPLFLVYAALLALSLFACILVVTGIKPERLRAAIRSDRPPVLAGRFLMINGTLVALLWLSTIVPPLAFGTVYPAGLEHYTTMIVQGFDLGIFLPLGFISGLLAVRKKVHGFIFSSIYTVFLTLLMLALCAKIVWMARSGANVFPVIFIMPTICLAAGILSFFILKNIDGTKSTPGGELEKILGNLCPVLDKTEYVYVSLESKMPLPSNLTPVGSFAEEEGMTLILAKEQACEAGLSFEGTFHRITLQVYSSLQAVGLTAAIASALSAHTISANVVAGYHHDHLFVPSRDAEAALACLKRLCRGEDKT